MAGLSKEDLAQMNQQYFQSLEKERLVEENCKSRGILFMILCSIPVERVR